MTAPSAPVDWVRLTPVQQVSDGEPGPARVSAVGALAFRDFRLLWIGLVASNIGSWVQDIASSWLLLQMTDSPLMVGLRGLFTSPAFIMASFWGGALADRMDRRKLVCLTQMAYVLSVIAQATLVATGFIQVWQIYVFGFLDWTIAAVDTAARQSLVPGLVPKEHLSSAVALMSSLRRGSAIIGPAIGGIVVASIGVAGAYYINAISYLPVLGAALLIRAAAFVPQRRTESLAEAMSAGVRYASKHRLIGGLMVLEAGQSFFASPISMMPVMALNVLHVGPREYGVMLTMLGVGALSATVTLILVGPRGVKGLNTMLASFAYPIVFIVFALSHHFGLSLGLLFLMGALEIVSGTLRNTVVQMTVEEAYRGRTTAFLSVAGRGVASLGGAPIGALASVIGAPFAISLGCLCTIATTVVVGGKVPEIAAFEHPANAAARTE